MSRGHGKVQRLVLAELDGRRNQRTSNLIYAWHMENCPRGRDGKNHYPSRSEQESVYRAVRSLARAGLIGIGYSHSAIEDGIPVRERNVNLEQVVWLRSTED